ncbi:haspin isoform X2 [Ptiloglossa arizonensis]|uniref:haspin isoform X2 n=1 Tax=Ptiloglossa arizonensis TaxID=3350558 RepID=UPI003F9FFD62
MNCKLPIRTYGKKKCKEVIIPVQKLHISTTNNIYNNDCNSINGELSVTEKKDNSNNSVFYDPFDTTFDRLIKNTRSPTRPLKICNVRATYSSINNSFDSSINTSKTVDYKCSLYDHIKLSNVNTKSVSKQKVLNKKAKIQIEKNTVKRNRQISQNVGKSKVKKNNLYEKYKLLKVRNKNSEISTSEVEDHSNRFKNNAIPYKKSNKNCVFRNNEKSSDALSSIESLKVMSCSVVLDKLNVLKWKNKMNDDENKLSKETQKSVLEFHESLEHPEIVKSNINNIKHSNINMKPIVKVEQLELTSVMKSLPLNKKYENVISSTPIGKPLKLPTHLISLSPIPIKYSKKLNEPITCTDNISISANNTNNLVSLEFQQINVDLCGKSGALEKHIIKKQTDLPSSYRSNTSKCSNYNLSQSEKLDKREHLTQVTPEELLESGKSTTETKRNNILDVSSELMHEHAVTNKLKRNHLNFSIDADRSLSLFDNTNKSIQTSLYNVNTAINIVQVSSSNLMLDKVNKESNNEPYSTFIKLSKKSTSNIDNDEVGGKLDKVKEELSKILIPDKLTISHASLSDTSIIKETESLLHKSSTLSTNKSLISNEDKCCNAIQPCVVLKQLLDPIRITRRRKQYRKWELDLADISENSNNNIQFNENKIYPKRISENKKPKLSKKTLQSSKNIVETFTSDASGKIEKPIYLKPGKSWARSLSILNNIRRESNLDRLSIGKGKKWKDIVMDVLNMQNQGVIQSCIRKTENDKELQVSNEAINKTELELANNKGRTYDSTSLGRLTRRISVRVVPINKTITIIEDAPFLEVYGIVPVKSQTFTLINNSQKSSICNIQNNDTYCSEKHIVSTAKEVILERCSQKDYIPFSIYFSDLYLESCRKIGEGVYGEVFLYEYKNKKTVIKIIPIEGNEYVNGEPQKKFHEILSEIVIAMELHNLRFNTKYNTDGFVELKNIKCLKGKYPRKLVELWNIYDEEKRSENDCPSMFNDDQLFIVLELSHGGQDLEAFTFHTAEVAHILFMQAALALAVAEKAIEFEHRDLHWGNVLISPTTESHVHYKLGQKEIELISKGVKVSIIDFTLSRISYQECSVFNDLASDPSLFTAQGEYQFEIYRLMRDKIKNNWQKFEPYTNILWLHYTLDKMITAVRYRRRNLKTHKNGIVRLKELKNKILTYSSAFDFVTNCDKVASLLCIESESKLVSA